MSGSSGISVNAAFSFLITALWTSLAYAANPYGLGELDYFHKKSKTSTVIAVDTNWEEVSDRPPEAVVKLLDNPTPENARAYLAWQKLKIKRIIQAQMVIDQVAREEQ